MNSGVRLKKLALVFEHFGRWGQHAEKYVYLHQLSLRSTGECGNSNSSVLKHTGERLSVQLQKCNSVIYRKIEGRLNRCD